MLTLRRLAAPLALALSLAGPASAGRQLLRPRGPRGSPALQASPVSVSPPRLQYCGGRVLSQTQIVAVAWGPLDSYPMNGSCDDTPANCLTRWFQDFTQDPQFAWLDEYQTTIPAADGSAGTQQHILAPTFYGLVQITPANQNATVGGIEIESELSSQIAAGNLPAPVDDPDFPGNTETLYEVFFPLAVNPSDPDNAACVDFCAYHDSYHSNSVGKNVQIAVIPSQMSPSACSVGCGDFSDNWLGNMGKLLSHESIEAITDPDVGFVSSLGCEAPYGWYDFSGKDDLSEHAEIGDMCEFIPDTHGQVTEVTFQDSNGLDYSVQRVWSNRYTACLGDVADAFSISVADQPVLVGVGSAVNLTLHTTAPQGGGTLPVTFSVHGLPAHVAAEITPPIVNAGQDAMLTLSIQEGATQTGGAFGIAAEAGSAQAQTTVQYSAPDFSADLSSGALSLTAGGAAQTLTLATAITSGDARSFTASLAGLPGVAVTPATAALGGDTTLSFSAAAGTPSAVSGTYQLLITSAGIQHVLPISVTVSGDDASLTVPMALTVAQGGSLTFALTASTTHGNPQALALTAENLPAGANATFAPATLTTGQAGMVTLTVPADEQLGTLQFKLRGQGPVEVYSVTTSVQVVAPSGCSTAPLGWLALAGLFSLALRRRAQPA